MALGRINNETTGSPESEKRFFVISPVAFAKSDSPGNRYKSSETSAGV